LKITSIGCGGLIVFVIAVSARAAIISGPSDTPSEPAQQEAAPGQSPEEPAPEEEPPPEED
jgi:hypothetical protein